MRNITTICLAALLMALSGGNAFAADFYKGKTIKIISGGSAGGGYDTHTRLVAVYISKYIPGNPKIIVQNMAEGSGVSAANFVYNIAPKDGTVLGQFTRDSILKPIVGLKSAKFKPGNFNWLGSPASYSDNAYAIFIRSALPYKGIADMRKAKTPLNFGNRGDILVPLVGEGLGANIKVIKGYKGQEVNLAIERGELDGGGTSYSNIKRRTPHWLTKKIVRIVVQYGHAKRVAILPDVPTAQELAQTPDDLALIKFCELPLTFGYAFAAPPGVPEKRVALLRKAFQATMKDPKYVAALKKAKLEYTPKSGENLANDIKEAANSSPKVIARYKKMTGEAGATTN